MLLNLSLMMSLSLLLILNLTVLLLFVDWLFLSMDKKNLQMMFVDFFYSNSIWLVLFVALCFMNLISLNLFSFPITTLMMVNFIFAFIGWLSSVILLVMMKVPFSVLTPTNTPWYLIFFLNLIEAVSSLVRSFTLSFRLMANLSAGHILLALISKLPFFSWVFGVLFGLLELVVCLVQGYVFILLLKVYMEEHF